MTVRKHVYCPYCASGASDINALRAHLLDWHALGEFTVSLVIDTIGLGLASLGYDDRAAVGAPVDIEEATS